MTLPDFLTSCTLERIGPESFTWQVPDGWLQGRGAWGGLVVAAHVNAAEAVQHSVDDSRRVRNIAAHLFGPLPSGPAQVQVNCLRAGSAMTTWQVSIVGSDGELASQAVVITGTSRPVNADETWGVASMPILPPWSQLPLAPVRPPIGPEFGAHFAYRPASGIPGEQKPPQASGWIGPAEEGEPLPEWTAATTLGIVDAWWPASYVTMPSVRPMGTVSFSAHLLVDPATLDPGAPLAYEAWVSRSDEGFTSETRRLWSPDGRLVVENHQSIVVIK
jgi:hypothetical protein